VVTVILWSVRDTMHRGKMIHPKADLLWSSE